MIFLDKVTVTHELIRRSAWVQQKGTHKFWEPHLFSIFPREGIIIGKRSLTNGYTMYDGEEGQGPTGYCQTKRFTAYLVAYAMSRKPMLVLPEHIELI